MKTWPGWLNIPFGILIGLICGAVILLVARQPSGAAILLEPKATPAPLVVHVDGAVASPGVYALAPGSRVQDAVAQAGGLTNEAETASLNLAAALYDGQKIYVPKAGEPAPLAPSSGQDSIIDLNTASLEELITLPGIGEDRANAIIAYRQEQGGFQSIEEIQNIEGIGPATFEKLKERIRVSGQP
jgi:competence protein ComEA